jgi:hypothetical protein
MLTLEVEIAVTKELKPSAVDSTLNNSHTAAGLMSSEEQPGQ